ncbi:hypothetical protein SARC_05535 [Sphaeroforma arctica JP610]|uniref:Uncharacterized protein n=1 Tax=Sphaeroforma arctica JP610 TaxID=667725 RepID=A0A0L0FZB8_9EUKA|nr:hypothetical protein SARC_05535 [Sphaeroforma arctica JP610]KNC82177.1 hypothetical protein SARC_05535 [Sphaeroforma arctica JP610]|eukprot:XP_014156079.1 hypothetical protein SARC_05535 [Sphaeroforma arctica JP610]
MHVSDQPETVASVRGNTTVSSDDDECEFYDASSVPVSRRSSGSGDRTAPAPGPKPNPRGQGRGPEVRQVGKTDDTAHEVGRTSGQLQRLRPHQSNGTTDHSGDTSEPASDTSQQRVSGPKSQQQRTENRTPHASESGARVQHSSAEWGEIDDGRKEDRIGGRLTAKKSAGTFGSGEWHPRRTPGHSADVVRACRVVGACR